MAQLQSTGITGSLNVTGTATANGSILGGGNLFLRSYNTDPKGIFFRDGFEYGDANQYNLSITIYDDGDGAADGMNINAYDGIYFNVQSGTTPSTAFRVLNTEVRSYKDFISTGTVTAATSFISDAIGTSNNDPGSSNAQFNGYGVIGNRGAFYLTNANTDSSATVQIGVGGVHNAAPKLTVGTSTSTFNTNVTVDGDMTVTGTVTAQEFHTEYVSSSILFESGSTAFGNTDDDVHNFTGTITVSRVASASTLTFFRDANLSTNTLIGQLLFEADYQDSPIDYARIDVKSNASAVRTDMDFVVKSTSGNLETALKLQGGSATPKAFFYNEVSASAFIGDGSQLTNVTATSAGNADTVDSKHATDFTLDYVTDNGSTTANSIQVGNTTIRASAIPTLTIDDNGNAGGGGAEGLILFKNNDGNAIGLGYTADVTTTSDLLISTNANSTYGGYLGLDVAAIDDPADIILDAKTNVLLAPESGSVGIGTISPASVLHVNTGTGTGTANTVIIDRAGSSDYSGISFATAGTVDWSIGHNSAGNFEVFENGADATTRLTIETGGNVGIGTASTAAHLHIYEPAASNTATTDMLKLQAYTGDFGATPAAIALAFKFQDSNNLTNEARIRMASVNDTDYGDNDEAASNLIFSTTNDGTESDKMIITGRGEVGIGTTNPTYTLDVIGEIGVDSYIRHNGDTDTFFGFDADNSYKIRTGGTDRFAVTSDVNINSATDLNINGASRRINFTSGTGTIRTTTANALYLATNSSTAITIDSSQNVGIGTTSPQKAFEVISPANDFVSVGARQISVGQWTGIHFGYRENNTSYRKSAIVFERTDLTSNDAQGKIHILNGPQGSSSSATLSDAKITIAENGNVGIGETSPTAKLEVYGSGSTVLDIQGSQGQLFSITDDLTGDLLVASDISGIPIFTVNAADGVTVDGDTVISGSLTVTGSDNSQLTVLGNASFGLPGNGSNTLGRYISIEGNADASGEGSGRIFFTEHNSTTTSMSNYGVSIGYRGGGTSIVGADGNTWTGLSAIGNGQWGMWGHDNDATGALIMFGDRSATYVDFSGNNIQGINDIYVADQIIHTGDTDTYTQFHAADQWRVVTGGTERLEVNNTITTVQGDIQVLGDLKLNGTDSYIWTPNTTSGYTGFWDQDNGRVAAKWQNDLGWGFLGDPETGYAVKIHGATNITGDIEADGVITILSDTSGTTAGNRGFQVNKTTKGALHVEGAQGGTSGAAYTVPLITFPGNTLDAVQGGIYLSQNSSTGTTLGIFTTDSYSTGPQEGLIVYDNGTVVIPRNVLNLNANNITSVGNIYLASAIYHDGDTNTYTQFHAADQWRVVTGGTERLEVNNSAVTTAGRLNVGEHVIAAGNVYSSGNEGFVFGSSTSEGEYIDRSGNDIYFVAGGSERMRIDGDGNGVGIGTTDPAQQLTIRAAVNSEYSGGNSSNGTNISNHLSLIGTATGRNLVEGPTIAFIAPANTDGSNLWALARILGGPGDTGNGSARGALHLQVRDAYDPLSDGTSWNWRTGLSIINNGNVGIGSTAPAYDLDVAGNMRSTNMYLGGYLYHDGDTNTYIRMIAADDMQLVAGGRQMLRMDEGTDPDKLRFVTDDNWTNSSGDWNMSGDVTVGGRFRRLERDREYSSITGTATADGWYLIGTITDNGSTPTTFHVQTYAHSSVMFTISDAYGPSNYAHIQVLDHIYGANGGYANVKGIRVRNDGTVAIQLGWSSGPSVAVKVSAFGPGDLVLPSTLALETSTATVNDTVSLTTATKGMMRSHGTMDAPTFRNTNNTSYSLTPQSAATGYWQVNTPSGYLQIGPANTSWCHFNTDRPAYWFSKQITVEGGVVSSYNEDLQLWRSNSSADRIQIADTHIKFVLDSAEDMRLENDGDLHVEGDVIAYSTTISDSRLKDDVITIGGALDKVKKLRGVEYTWNNGSRKNQRDLGLIAQEVEQVIPEVVREKKMPLMDDSETKYKTVDYEKLTAVLIEGMKEQQAQIEELKARIDELERK